jgi:hypothetical protein
MIEARDEVVAVLEEGHLKSRNVGMERRGGIGAQAVRAYEAVRADRAGDEHVRTASHRAVLYSESFQLAGGMEAKRCFGMGRRLSRLSLTNAYAPGNVRSTSSFEMRFARTPCHAGRSGDAASGFSMVFTVKMTSSGRYFFAVGTNGGPLSDGF